MSTTKEDLKNRVDAIQNIQGVKHKLNESMSNPKKYLYDFIDDNDIPTGETEVVRWEDAEISLKNEPKLKDYSTEQPLMGTRIRLEELEERLKTPIIQEESNFSKILFKLNELEEAQSHLKELKREGNKNVIVRELELQPIIMDETKTVYIEKDTLPPVIIDESTNVTIKEEGKITLDLVNNLIKEELKHIEMQLDIKITELDCNYIKNLKFLTDRIINLEEIIKSHSYKLSKNDEKIASVLNKLDAENVTDLDTDYYDTYFND